MSTPQSEVSADELGRRMYDHFHGQRDALGGIVLPTEPDPLAGLLAQLPADDPEHGDPSVFVYDMLAKQLNAEQLDVLWKTATLRAEWVKEVDRALAEFAGAVPRDRDQLAELLRSLSEGASTELYDRLIAQAGNEAGWTAWAAACFELDAAAEQDEAQDQLTDQMTAAQQALRAAQVALTTLQNYAHAEYEGQTGEDLTAFLADAARSLRAAHALNPAL